MIFDESHFPFSKITNQSSRTYDFLDDSPSPYVTHFQLKQPFSENTLSVVVQPTPTAPTLAPPNVPSSLLPRPVTRSQRGIFKPRRQLNLLTSVTISPLPRNPVSALTRPELKLAMLDEFNALIENKTWELYPVLLMLILCVPCGFLLIKNTLMFLLRYIRPIL